MEQEVKSGEVFSSKLGDIEKATESFNKAIKGNGIGTTEGGEILQKGLITAVPQEASRLDISTAIAAAAGKNDKINDLPPGMVLRVARAHADGKWEWDAGSDIAADLNALVADGVSGDEYRKNLNEQSVLQLSATDVLKRAKDRFAKTIFPKGTGAAEKQGEIIKAIDNDYKNKTMGQSNIVPPTNTEESSGTSPAVNNMSKIDNAAGGTELGDFRRTGTQLDNVKKAFVRDVTFPWTRRTIGNAFNTGNNAIMDAGEQLARQVFNAAPNSAKAKKNVLISLGAPKNIVPAKSPSEFREQLAQWENRKAIKPQRELKYGDEGFGLGNVRR